MTEPNSVQHPAPESGATVEPTDDLRRAVIHAIARRQSLAAKPGGDAADLADAAIAAYRKHPDGAAADRDAATRWHPIETAPRDGSWLLGAFGASGLCIFRRHDVGGRYEAWVTHEGAACKAPQYWMPLPANPWRAKP